VLKVAKCRLRDRTMQLRFLVSYLNIAMVSKKRVVVVLTTKVEESETDTLPLK
jgi:hypothetical protein